MTMFKKAQEVTLLREWNSNQVACFQQAIVHSCGKKQMVLTCAETGEELGRHFSPTNAYTKERVVARVEGEAAFEAARQFAEELRQREIESLRRQIASPYCQKNADWKASREAELARVEAAVAEGVKYPL